MNNTASDKYDLSNANIKDLLTEFFEFYTTPAFGARSKSEIDLKVFELLRERGDIDDDYYKVSRKLKITPTRAKNLILNAKLRRESENYDEKFIDLLKNLKFKISVNSNEIILLYVPDILFREHIKAILKQKGIIWDSSFNSEIVKIRLDDFLDIVYEKLKFKDSLIINWEIEKPKIKEKIFSQLKDVCKGMLSVIIEQISLTIR